MKQYSTTKHHKIESYEEGTFTHSSMNVCKEIRVTGLCCNHKPSGCSYSWNRTGGSKAGCEVDVCWRGKRHRMSEQRILEFEQEKSLINDSASRHHIPLGLAVFSSMKAQSCWRLTLLRITNDLTDVERVRNARSNKINVQPFQTQG